MNVPSRFDFAQKGVVPLLFGLILLVQASNSQAVEIETFLYTRNHLRECLDAEGCLETQNTLLDESAGDTGTTGQVTSHTADPTTTMLTEAATSAGYVAESFLPALSMYAYSGDPPSSSGQRRYSVQAHGMQRYEFLEAGTIAVSATLTYSQTGGADSHGNMHPRGAAGGGIYYFRMAGDVLETDNCNEPPLGPDGLATLVECILFNGQDGIEFTGQEDYHVAVMDAPRDPVTNGTLTASLTISGNAGDVFFIGAYMTAQAHLSGFVDARNTLLMQIDDPSLVQATFAQETFVPALPPGPEVDIDIRPLISSNVIVPRIGFVPVAIFGSETFDALQIDPSTLEFGPGRAPALPWLLEGKDINRDGFADVVAIFRTRDTGIRCGDTAALLTGKTVISGPFNGTDSIKTIGCHERPWRTRIH